MNYRDILRLSFLALFVGAASFAVGACDSNGGGGPSVVRDSMQIASVSPHLGADLETTDTSFTVTFTDPVIQNEYTRTDVEPTGGDRHLIDVIRVYSQAKRASTHNFPVELAFNDKRTKLTITPEKPLQDGFIYNIYIGDKPNNASDRGTGFYDPRFKSKKGARFGVNPNYPPEVFQFSIGLSEEKPAVPSVSFDTESQMVNENGEIADAELDYTYPEIRVPLQVDDIDDSAAKVKGYEVYYRSQNQAGRTGSGDKFVQAFDVQPEADPGDFEDDDGIIPASAVESDGELDFVVEVDGYPFAGDDGSYGPIEWKVRAVSINNVRSDFTNVITTDDNTPPFLDYAVQGSRNDNNEVESLTLQFTEPLDSGTVSPSAFTVQDDNGDPVDLAGTSLENAAPGQSETTVELTFNVPQNDVVGYEVEVNDAETANPVTDLAGNGLFPGSDSDTLY